KKITLLTGTQLHNSLLQHVKKTSLNPRAFIILAINFLAGTICKPNYEMSQNYLEKALQFGLYSNKNSNGLKKFHDIPFLDRLGIYTITLISYSRKPQPQKTKKILLNTLQKIYTAVKNAGLESLFCAAVLQETKVDLTKESEWNTLSLLNKK
ncbi:MAG TPA: hypothetical protein VL201_01660, partial [Patescibacteria group bacterium]|nr:hypothetical protein [Patescibacteria group bacterium]